MKKALNRTKTTANTTHKQTTNKTTMGRDWDDELSCGDSLKSTSQIEKENNRRDHDHNDGYTGLCRDFDIVSGAGSFTTPMIGSEETICTYIETNTEKWQPGLIVYWQTIEDSPLLKLRQKVRELREKRSASRKSMRSAATLKMRTKKSIKCSGCGSCIATSHINLDRSNKCPVCRKPQLVKILEKKSLDTQVKKAEERVYAREKLLREKSEEKRRKVEKANAGRKTKEPLPPLFRSGVYVGGWGPY